MIAERTYERYQFTGTRCDTRWATEYEALHITDAEGNTWSFYRPRRVALRGTDGGADPLPGLPPRRRARRLVTRHASTAIGAAPTDRGVSCR